MNRVLARDVLGQKDLQRPRLDVRRIQEVVAENCGTTAGKLRGRDRTSRIALVRQVAVYFSREFAAEKMTWVDLGKSFNRDHTTMISSYKVIEKLVQEDARFHERLLQLRNVLYEECYAGQIASGERCGTCYGWPQQPGCPKCAGEQGAL